MEEGEPRFEEELPVEEVKKSLDNKEPSLEKELQSEGEQEKVDTMDSKALSKKAVEYIVDYLKTDMEGMDWRKVDKDEALKALAGIDSDEAWEIREKFLDKYPQSVLDSLSGLDSPKAWKMREKFLKEENTDVAKTLIGLDSDKAWRVREKILKQAPKELVHGIQNPDFWNVRAPLLAGIAGLESEDAWELRDACLKKEEDPYLYGQVASSLSGLDSERAWEMRDYLLSKVHKFESLSEDAMKHLLKEHFVWGLVGLDSNKAWEMRDNFIADNYVEAQALSESGMDIPAGYFAKQRVLESLAGVDSERAWKLREEAFAKDDAMTNQYLAESLSGLDSDRAWEIRKKLMSFPGSYGHTDVMKGIYGGPIMAAARKVRYDQIEKQKTK